MPMLQRALAFADRHATARSILAALAASVILGAIPLTYAISRIAAGQPDVVPLDILNSYTVDQAYAMIARYTADARDYYVFNALTVDIVGPACFALTVALLSTALLRRLAAGRVWRVFAVVGPAAGFAFDLVENGLLAAMVLRFPERLVTVATIANIATILKRGTIFATWALVLVPALLVLARTLLRPRARPPR